MAFSSGLGTAQAPRHRKPLGFVFCFVYSCLVLFAPAQQAAAQGFGLPDALNSNAALDAGDDEGPRLATDGLGTWIAAWSSDDTLGGTIGNDSDILYARSTDDGATWTVVSSLNTDATIDAGIDTELDISPTLVTDGLGTWLASWASFQFISNPDQDIMVSRSTDAGATWTTPARLDTSATTDTAADANAHVATGGAGTWIAVWNSTSSLGGTIGTDRDILIARSTDAAVTWTVPVALNTNAGSDTGDDILPRVTTDGLGNWVTVWRSSDSLGSTIGTDNDILVSRSTDAGVTWTAPAALNTNAATDSGFDSNPQLTTDGLGNWTTAWASNDSLAGTIGTDNDILVARSTDAGATWTGPVALNVNAATDSGQDSAVRLSVDSGGTWMAVWHSDETLGGTIGNDSDVLEARSSDAGATWSAPAAVNINAATDSGDDVFPEMVTDGVGSWVGVWQSDETLGAGLGADFDILFAIAPDSDRDNDGLTDDDEINVHNTDPLDPDSDDDGLNDGDEINVHSTDPLDPDSDDDGLTDLEEVTGGSDPNDPGSPPGPDVPSLTPPGAAILALVLYVLARRPRIGATRAPHRGPVPPATSI